MGLGWFAFFRTVLGASGRRIRIGFGGNVRLGRRRVYIRMRSTGRQRYPAGHTRSTRRNPLV